jgi:peptide/nickel transport system substrate-binding protein
MLLAPSFFWAHRLPFKMDFHPNRRTILSGFGLTGVWAGSLMLGGCTPIDDSDILRVVPYADLQSIDPVVTTIGIVQRHSILTHDFLFGRDRDQNPQPQMVDTWSVSDDGLSWRFHLRDGLAFHDGSPVTAADVVASLKRWGMRDAYGRQIFAITRTFEAIDARTVSWQLDRPYGLMLHALSKTGGPVPAIMPARLAQTPATTPLHEVMGSGPYRFVAEEWIPGSKVVYRRNDAYIPRAEPPNGMAGGKIARVGTIEWLNIRDPQSAVLALANGEIDFVENPAPEFLPMLAREGLRIERTDPLGTQGMLRMNHLHPPFDDPRARQALFHLVNQADFLQAMFGNPDITETCHSFFGCGSPLSTQAGVPPGIGHDREKAKALMAAAGYDGRPIVILHPTDIQFMNIATLVLGEALKSIGMTVDLQAMDFGAMSSRRTNRAAPENGGWHIGLTYWPGNDIADPVGNIPLQANGDQAWPGWPDDPVLQAMIDRFPYVQSPKQRQSLADQIQIRAYQSVPYVPIGQWHVPVAYSPRLSGVLSVPGTTVFWNIEKGPRVY